MAVIETRRDVEQIAPIPSTRAQRPGIKAGLRDALGWIPARRRWTDDKVEHSQPSAQQQYQPRGCDTQTTE